MKLGPSVLLILCITGCFEPVERPSRREAMVEYLDASADCSKASAALHVAEGARDILIAGKAVGTLHESYELTNSREQVRGLTQDAQAQRLRANLAKSKLDAT